MTNTLAEKIFYFLVFMLPFSFALNPGSDVDLAVTRVLIPLLFLVWLFACLKNRTLKIDIRPRFMFLLAFVFIISVSYFWASDQSKAIRKIMFIGSFLPIYFVSFSLLQRKKPLMIFLKTLFWTNLTVATLGIVQFLMQFVVGIDPMIKMTENYINPFFLGNNFSLAVSQFPSWLVGVGNFTLLRAFAVFPDPHLFSLFLNLFLPLVFLLWKKTKKSLYLWGFFVILAASLLSFSRAGHLALAAAFIGGLFVFNLAQKLIKRPLFVIPAILLFALFFVIDNPIKERIFSSFNFSEGSVSGRLEMWQTAIEITLSHPLGGVGIGNFSTALKPSSDLRDPSYAHNLFLDFSSETGIPSAILLLLLLFSPIFYYFKYPRSDWNKVLCLSFLILFIHCLFETPFYSVRVFPLILVLLSIKQDEK